MQSLTNKKATVTKTKKTTCTTFYLLENLNKLQIACFFTLLITHIFPLQWIFSLIFCLFFCWWEKI